MPVVTSIALSHTANVLPVSDGHSEKRNAAVFIVTNGNEIGDPTAVENEAKSPHAADTPIYIVNIQSESSPQTNADLRKIATSTHGYYWSSQNANPNKIVSDVDSTVTSYQEPDHGQNWEVFDFVASGVCLALAGVAYKRRKHMPINNDILKGVSHDSSRN